MLKFRHDDPSEWNAAADVERILHVRWLLNAHAAPLKNVAVHIVDGQIAAIRSMPDALSVHALNAVLVPPFVNVHAHLEFSGLAAPLQPSDSFTDWIRTVIEWRHSQTDSAADQIARGITESLRAGVTAIGEIATSDVWPPADETPRQQDLTVVSFREVLGFSTQRIEQQLDVLRQHVARTAARNIRPAVSPHAPYSVHPDLLANAVDIAVQQDVPVAMHLAETRDELQLLDSGTGRFADLLKQMQIWPADVFPGRLSIDGCLQQLSRAHRALAVHGNYLTDNQMRFLVQHPSIATVYCPRTHSYFSHGSHPWKRLRQAGATLVLGTDGRGSNPDLSIWSELQWAARQDTQTPAALLLGMITTDAADAIGLQRSDFVLCEGRPLDAVLVSCPSGCNDIDAWLPCGESRPIAAFRDGNAC